MQSPTAPVPAPFGHCPACNVRLKPTGKRWRPDCAVRYLECPVCHERFRSEERLVPRPSKGVGKSIGAFKKAVRGGRKGQAEPPAGGAGQAGGDTDTAVESTS